ncbi:dimeric dUTPase (all-alpha-NTP-PPase superfamily) [Clostridium beijerinckii]|nr:dimeric dUTPase (all-alpha-NTP-PPase superfamily) [Clostridium beijerinckii]
MAPNDYCLSDQFLNLYIDINDLIAFPSIDHYLTLFEDLLSLGLTLGFSESQIQNQFIKDLDNLVIL